MTVTEYLSSVALPANSFKAHHSDGDAQYT